MQDNRSHFERANALSSAEIGFEFEFYSDILKGKVAEQLSELLKKKVTVTERYHSLVKVDANNFKLEPDFSGGAKMMEFITGPLPYNEAIPVLIKTLNWIDKNGWTTDRCAFQFSVSFDKNRKDVKDKIETLDKLKFVLGLDEAKIYSDFGTREKNVYAKSIKKVLPINRFSILENITTIDPRMYRVPNDKYYGVNFTKLPKGYIEFRYLGNRDYQKKIKSIREVIDYVILYLYDILSRRISGYSEEDLVTLQKMMSKYSKVVRSFANPEFFFRNFPDFHVFIDLRGWDDNVKTYFAMIREKIFDLIVEGNITSCFFNYDTTTGRFQVKEARSRGAFEIEGFDLISCDIKNATIRNCSLYNTVVKKSVIENSMIFSDCKIISSKIKDTGADFGNELKDCFIDCKGKNINCKVDGGVLREGNVGENAEISKETLKVKSQQDLRMLRFVTDLRLKDQNDKYLIPRFGNMNY